jgi:hypothetical protein
MHSLIGAFALAGLFVVQACKVPTKSTGGDTLVWKVENSKWDAAAETQFSSWIEKLGTARAAGKCSKLGECLQNPEVNSLYGADDARLDVFADCADVPMVLRAYFAFKTKRPYAIAVVNGTVYGAENATTGSEVDQTNFQKIDELFNSVKVRVHSGFYRTKPEDQNTDTYPITVNRKTVRPGTVFYDPNGHVLMVYKVELDGTVRLMDGHPDNSLTIQRFGEKFARGGRSQGGGFRNWRPYQLETDGRLVRQPNFALPDFSADAQYQATYSEGGYHKWVKKQLSSGGSEKPVVEFQERAKQLCVDVADRVISVNSAMARGVHLQDHPAKLPVNIFGTEGDWESYSTPSRDARLKAAFRELHGFVKETTQAVGTSQKQYDFVDVTSKSALLAQYSSIWRALVDSPSCQFSYQSSSGQKKSFNIDDVANRLFDMSFDPYHCPELRWGLKPGHPEYDAAECSKNGKLDWYQRESSLRNAIDREYGSPTPLGWGPASPSDVNVPSLLQRLIGATSGK